MEDWAVCDGSIIADLRRPWHLVCFVLNIFAPGIGTMLSAFSSLHDKTYQSTERRVNFGTLVDGILQQLLTVVLVGWVWSILFGYALYVKVARKKPQL